MVQYKYQATVDGFAASYDGTVWKLLSNSVVFFVASDDNPWRFELWFMPLLSPRVTHFETTVSQMGSSVSWCIENDVACKNMAAAARQIMGCAMRPEVILEYTSGILRHVQDLHHG